MIDDVLRGQLVNRQQKLAAVVAASGESSQLMQLLQEVDAALERADEGSYGLCEVCQDPIEAERLIADPVASVCLGCLTPSQQRALEQDLQLAALIQEGLLPCRNFAVDGWRVSFHYEAATLVGGDYCDVLEGTDGSLYFMLGDVSGKGVAASMLMSHLHAMFRTLIPVGLPLGEMLERASRVFCESTLPTHYATLVCGRASKTGEVEICNAGHLPPLLLHDGEVTSIAATGLPLGVFCNEQFTVNRLWMAEGDTLLLYTDGLSEALNHAGTEYGPERLANLIKASNTPTPESLIGVCRDDLTNFLAGAPKFDDLTIMAIRRQN
jgi:sigma-B regulation protein RsbU (phosphoserine phosphatase)